MSTASTLLPKYLEPIRDKSLTKSDDIKLFHRIQKILVSTMSQLSCVPKFSSLDLPYNMRVILVCTFLASHNPARLDKRFFCKGKSSRRKVKSRPGSKVNEAMKGPKSFPLDRLVAIYSSITQVTVATLQTPDPVTYTRVQTKVSPLHRLQLPHYRPSYIHQTKVSPSHRLQLPHYRPSYIHQTKVSPSHRLQLPHYRPSYIHQT